MASVFFKVHPKILLEYQFNTKSLTTGTDGFRRINNLHDNTETIVNVNASKTRTGNVVDWTSVELSDGKMALMDTDAAFFYPVVDSDVTIQPVTFAAPHTVQYDTVRLHLVSGYNFDDIQGFVSSFYMRSRKERQIRLCSITFLKGDTDLLFFNPRPKKISELVFDKYVEFHIPSGDKILDEQDLFPNGTDTLAYKFSNGDGLSSQRSIYCSLSTIRNVFQDNGITYMEKDAEEKFLFNSSDQFNLLTASIQENPLGYFEYAARWNGDLIEDFIFRLNSIAGNRYVVIHELVFFAQYGLSFVEVENFSTVQTNKYDDIKVYRPVIMDTSNVTSLSVEYSVRLYNQANGNNVLKSSSLSTLNVAKYGTNLVKLNVGDTTQPLKVYNKVVKKDSQIVSSQFAQVLTKIAYVFIDAADITAGAESEIRVHPFDNVWKFSITKSQVPQEAAANVRVGRTLEAVELDDVSNYYLTFMNPDGTKLYVPELLSNDFKKSEGELVFKADSERAKTILALTDNRFFIVSKSPNAVETVITHGTWTAEAAVQPDVIRTTATSLDSAAIINAGGA